MGPCVRGATCLKDLLGAPGLTVAPRDPGSQNHFFNEKYNFDQQTHIFEANRLILFELVIFLNEEIIFSEQIINLLAKSCFRTNKSYIRSKQLTFFETIIFSMKINKFLSYNNIYI